MKTLDLVQGTPAWLQARQQHFTASEAPAMMGDSKYQSRNQLLQLKKTGTTEEVDPNTQRLFDKGHASEASIRPHIESIVGEELFPVTGSESIDDLPLLASFDGLTMMEDVIFEHKLWSEFLAGLVRDKNLSLHYIWQLEQQLLVSGAKKVIFVTSDGTPDKLEYMWYESSPELQGRLVAGWKQFAIDLENYEPEEAKAASVAEVIKDLPIVSVSVTGELTSCNISDITPEFDKFLDNALTELKTDQDFADAEAQAKKGREAAKKCESTAQDIIGQITSINDVVNTLNEYKARFNQTALLQEKLVKTEKELIKRNIAEGARLEIDKFICDLETETFPVIIVVPHPDFVGAMKNKRTIESLKNAVSTLLASSKIGLNEIAARIRTNLAYMKDKADGYEFLFNDLQQIADFGAIGFEDIVSGRVLKYQEQEKEKEAQAKKAAEIEATKEKPEHKVEPEAHRETAQDTNQDIPRVGKTERDRLLIALHDAISSPKGTVPKSANEFYRQDFYDATEAA